MTSSLVGSEMCIRDRCFVRHLKPTRRTISCALEMRAAAGDDGCRESPVSYTHLTLPTICSV
eukprot:9962761-Prorocentrum_lima.AAC.1